MQTVLFYIFYALSHHYATFRLGKDLQKRGYRVVYAGQPHVKFIVLEEGFEFYQIIEKDHLLPFPLIRHLPPGKKSGKEFEKEFMESSKFDTMIELVRPDLIVFDTSFAHFAFDLLRYKIPVVIAQTMVSLEKRSNFPPANVGFVPRNSWLSKLVVEFQWRVYFSIRFFQEIKCLVLYNTCEKLLLRKKLKSLGLDPSQVNWNRFLHFGINCFPEIVFPPAEFDFDFEGPANANEICVGFHKEFERKPISFHEKYYRLKDRLQQRPIVYCALGSMSAGYFKTTFSFYEKVIQIFEEKPDYNLILCLGGVAETVIPQEFYDALPDNIFIFVSVPQVEVLKKCQLMLTHGGVNSIVECISNGVPMIVFPLIKWVDQEGNAARVSYYGMGLTGNIMKDSKEAIREKIVKVLEQKKYKENTLKMRDRIRNNDKYPVFIDALEKYMSSYQKA